MTNEIFEKLTPYRENLYTSTYGDYVRLMSIKDKEILGQIYKEHFNKDSKMLNGCTRCLLSNLKELGKDYFQKEEELNKKDKKDIEDGNAGKTKQNRKTKPKSN